MVLLRTALRRRPSCRSRRGWCRRRDRPSGDGAQPRRPRLVQGAGPEPRDPVDGFRAAFPTRRHARQRRRPDGRRRGRPGADVAIVVAGYTSADEGEYVGQDTMTRPELSAPLPARCRGLRPLRGGGATRRRGADEARADHDRRHGRRPGLAAAPPDRRGDHHRGGGGQRSDRGCRRRAGAVLTEAWRHLVPATLLMWYAGMEGGHALADVLTGRHNPSGRLPFSIPTSRRLTSRSSTGMPRPSPTTAPRPTPASTTRRGAAHPHGFGFSYTTFSIDDAVVVGPPRTARLGSGAQHRRPRRPSRRAGLGRRRRSYAVSAAGRVRCGRRRGRRPSRSPSTSR